jgi:hypothetical protein
MNTMEKLNAMSIISKYAQTKRENLYNNSLMKDEIKNIIVSYVTETENLFKKDFITLDEAVMRIAMAASYALENA